MNGDLGAVALAEPVAQHRPEVRAPGGQNVTVRGDTLLLHHKAHVVEGVTILLHIRCEGGRRHRRHCSSAVERGGRRHLNRHHHADTMIVFIRHNYIVVPVHCNAIGAIELSSRTVSVSIATFSIACQCRNHALRRDLADKVTQFGHDDIAGAVYCHFAWPVELSVGAISISISLLASARQCGHQAVRRDRADTIVLQVGHDDIAVPIHCHSAGAIKLSGGAVSVLIARIASARQCGHHALW
eukprot:1194245-Prorocentrum_minimum.AAC.4